MRTQRLGAESFPIFFRCLGADMRRHFLDERTFVDGFGDVAGASGGQRIISSTLQVLLRMMRQNMSPADAVAAPRIHHQWLPEELEIEAARLETLRPEMERFGHKVRVFADGRSGIESARRSPPDVLIVDIGLPELDGYDVVRLARAHASLQGVPLVALTGYSRPHGRPAPLEAGFTHHVVKPVEAGKLRALLAELPVRGD